MKKIYKRAVLFTLVSVLFAALFLSIFNYENNSGLSQQTTAVNIRVKVLDDYVKSFQKYSEQSLEIATFNTLDSMYELMILRGSAYSNSTDFNKTFKNCITCAYADCVTKTTPCPRIQNKTLTALINNITSIAYNRLNIKTSYSISSIDVYQEYPFDVEVEMVLVFSVQDVLERQYALWNVTKRFHQSVPITRLNDPLVGIHLGASRLINRYDGDCAFNETCWNLATAKAFYDSQQYRYHVNGTNYLQRFWNGTERSVCCGIESFIPNNLSSAQKSHVDNYYWTGEYDCPSIKGPLLLISGISPNFWIDYGSAVRYGLVNDQTATCP